MKYYVYGGNTFGGTSVFGNVPVHGEDKVFDEAWVYGDAQNSAKTTRVSKSRHN